MIHNPCSGCGRKPHCPEPCRPKEDYKRAMKKTNKRKNSFANHVLTESEARELVELVRQELTAQILSEMKGAQKQ